MSEKLTKFLITDQEAGERLDIALVKLLPNLSRSPRSRRLLDPK